MPRIEIDPNERDERFEEAHESTSTSTESFDRIAFAERVLALVRPPRMRVAVGVGMRRVTFESGRQWGAGEGARWGILRVPRDASRRAIASAVLGLCAGGPFRAFSLDVLVASGASDPPA